MKRLLSLLLLSLWCGCEGPEMEPAPQPRSSASPKAAKATVRPERAKTTQDYADVDAALAALSAALDKDDQPGIRGATTWLAKQGGSAVGPVSAEVQDPANDLRFRLACLNVLGYVGPRASSAILEATHSETPQVRAKAADMLGGIQPSSSQIVNRLMELLDEDDADLRRSAAGSLGRIGKPAERAAPKLQAILNSDADDSLRGAAKTALKRIDPRVGFGKQQTEEQ